MRRVNLCRRRVAQTGAGSPQNEAESADHRANGHGRLARLRRATQSPRRSEGEGGAQFPQGVRSGDGSPGAFRWAGGDVARGSEGAGLLTRRCGPGERPTPAVRSGMSGACGVRDRGARWAVSIPNARACFPLTALKHRRLNLRTHVNSLSSLIPVPFFDRSAQIDSARRRISLCDRRVSLRETE